MAIVLYYVDKMFPELALLNNPILLAALFGFVFGLGILITWISTFFATQRFLNLNTDRLY